MAAASIQNKKLTLNTNELEKEFFQDSNLIAFTSPVQPYKICWVFNNYFNLALKRTHHLEIQKNNLFHDVYYFNHNEKLTEYYLINNRINTQYLLPELKNLDFLFMCKGNEAQQKQSHYLTYLKKFNFITHVIPIPILQLKSKEYLLF